MRVPAGVRIDGRGVGGRFVSASSLAALASRVDDDAGYFAILDALADEADRRAKQLAKLQRKFDDDPKRYARRVDAAESAALEADTALDDVTAGIPTDEAPLEGARLPVYDSRAVEVGSELGYARSLVDAQQIAYEVGDAANEDVEDVWRDIRWYVVRFGPRIEPDDYNTEWEIGFEYRGSVGGGGRHKNVDVNIRIRREDGRAFGPNEAQRVLQQFQQNLATDAPNPVPRGYEMAAIDWRRPARASSGWSGGEEDYHALAQFAAPMYTRKDDASAWSINPPGIRLGGVKL